MTWTQRPRRQPSARDARRAGSGQEAVKMMRPLTRRWGDGRRSLFGIFLVKKGTQKVLGLGFVLIFWRQQQERVQGYHKIWG